MQTILAQTGETGPRQREGKALSPARRAVGDAADDPWNAPIHRLTRAEAEDLRRRQPMVSPWAVVGVQALLGLALAALAWLVFDAAVAISALYGAAVSVLPGALMARAATSGVAARASASPVAPLPPALSPAAPLPPALSAFRMLFWALVKIGVSVLLLALAPRLVQPLSWPALLAALVLCLQVYWFALLWRGRERPRRGP